MGKVSARWESITLGRRSRATPTEVTPPQDSARRWSWRPSSGWNGWFVDARRNPGAGMTVARRSARCHETMMGNGAMSWRSSLHRRHSRSVLRLQNEYLAQLSPAALPTHGDVAPGYPEPRGYMTTRTHYVQMATKGVNRPYLRPWGLRGHLRNDFANFRDDLWQRGTEELATAIDPVFSKSMVNLLLD